MSSSNPRVLILLFRRDLRITDNPLFYDLLQPAGKKLQLTHLLPVFIFNPIQLEVSGFLSSPEKSSPFPEARSSVGGFWRCGPHRAQFLAESVWDLKQNLRAVESDLVIRVGKSNEVLPAVVRGLKENGADVAGLWMAGAVGSEERTEERDIERSLRKEGVHTRILEDRSYLFGTDELPVEPKNVSDVFTSFRKTMEPLRANIHAPTTAPSSLPPLPPSIPYLSEPFHIPDTLEDLIHCLQSPLQDLGLPGPPLTMPPNAKSAHHFSGGELSAKKRLHHLLQSGSLTTYKSTRNGLLGDDFSTKLSSWLAQGCISARLIHQTMLRFEDGENWWDLLKLPKPETPEKADGFGKGENAGTGWVRFELLWRDYFRLCAIKFGWKVFAREGYREDTSYQWKSREGARGEFERWQRGSTGTGLVDASMRELYLTGWTSNRARQNVASYLAKRLGIDWRLGAEWYESLLVDYDMASNWGNWQYNAGVGNDPRGECRVFNQIKQANDYDPKGEYIKMWVEELRGIDNTRGVFHCSQLSANEKQKVIAHSADAKISVERPLVPAGKFGGSKSGSKGKQDKNGKGFKGKKKSGKGQREYEF